MKMRKMQRKIGIDFMVPDNVIEFAEVLASKSNMRQKMSAVIHRNGVILGQGYNHWLSTSTEPKNVIWGVPVRSIHAEVMCIRWTWRKYGSSAFKNSEIYIHRKGNLLAKPCPHCMQIIEMFGLKPSWSPL